MGFAIGAAAIGGALISSNAASNASSAQQNAANQASSTQQAQYNQARQDNSPWVGAGANALSQLNLQMPNLSRSFTTNDFQQDPGYQFNLQQGQQALQRSAAARGLLNSTGTMRDMSAYTQGQASNEFQNAQNRFTQNQTQRYNMLSNIAGLGQTSQNQINAAGANSANNISANQIGAGNASAAATIGQANSTNGMISNLGNTWMNYSAMNHTPSYSMPSGGGDNSGVNYFNGSNPYAE